MVAWLEKHQIWMYLLALVIGATTGLTAPELGSPLAIAINPVLGLLLYATFLMVPMARIGQGLKDFRFLGVLALLNFVLVPIVVFVLTRFIAGDQVLLVGVLFVLLAPCIDYVIVFTHFASGASARLLSATPLLMFGQMLLLPVYLWLFVGTEFVRSVDFAPFLKAFGFLIVVPLCAAGLTQYAAARTRWGQILADGVSAAMVPLMMATLAIIVASQIFKVSHQLSKLVVVVPLYVAFAVIMIAGGAVVSRAAGLNIASQRAVVFSAVTRNSLVVLPLVLALPAQFELAPLVVVTQTLVELCIMLVMILALPRILKPQAALRVQPQGS
ncbi:MAG TPA: arsenic resistance protein [Corynebacterium stationis]|uniref:arsenic resistance protein n=1 Tax=Corynebacterium stationis TaxID=1705 RepID=UPI001DC81138|nr:bile acid:sodium symporter [Corynebacterium stationis]HJG64960.1 arsenic resistance protein [Corynebacterium stationis]